VSAWKESTREEVVSTKIKELTFYAILPKYILVFSKIKYDICLRERNKTILHPFVIDQDLPVK
jgi:hypothetical protein